ncbi:hypothetical protein DYB35_009325 [Aphanomyces astaci]|uniref:Uncharacterized protein n=1 Tax=Aphanomyces astaci TaxID=112090 RepID=A0A3R6ZBG8_APHAT|nr:hypothetical protein DYB35_009325 [Aphanomyces astaci]
MRLKMHFEEHDDEIKARAKAYFALSQQHASEAEAKLKECASHEGGKCVDHMRGVLDKWARSVNDFEMIANEYGASFHDQVSGYAKQQRESIAEMTRLIKEHK